MNKIVCSMLLIFLFLPPLAAQEPAAGESAELSSPAAGIPKMSAGLLLEANANTREGVSFGGGLRFDYLVLDFLAVGTQVSVSSDFAELVTLEPSALVRWYVPVLGGDGKGLFVQGNLGASLIFEEGELTPAILGGLAAGYRFVFGSWFVEPFGRGGYPFLWGAGVSAGLRF
ncbi:hypothetical protein K7I13_06155 [Brucepastera parasyntrophica]|uniref:hypothetical protein n=1 Tax=Brucepastera parasyntrophica TaxID=2880008 RepID=UPI00210BC3F7|nr:hypothetical protein [Brucepastera parasyntrophica]ULQ60846.1 hypothetical protein K7I13_06155 [Brucepastera parasyntrophica]